MLLTFLESFNRIVEILGGYGGVGGLIGGLTGIIALFQTHLSRRVAKDSNELAKTANANAENSNKIAGETNKKSEDANQLAGEANKLSLRSLEIASDQTQYDWNVRFELDKQAMAVVNNSPNKVTDVRTIIVLQEQSISGTNYDRKSIENHTFKEIEADSEAVFKCPTLANLVDEKLEPGNNASTRQRQFGEHYVVVDIHIRWITELGRIMNLTMPDMQFGEG